MEQQFKPTFKSDTCERSHQTSPESHMVFASFSSCENGYKMTTKVCIVFNCAAKCNGIPLNDMIQEGPKLQEDQFICPHWFPLEPGTMWVLLVILRKCTSGSRSRNKMVFTFDFWGGTLTLSKGHTQYSSLAS